MLSASVLLALTGCGSEGTQSNTQLVGSVTSPEVTPPEVTPPVEPPACLEVAGYGTITLSNGQIWLDRNLGASRVPNNFNDTEASGNYYQWGRGADGHEVNSSLVYIESALILEPNEGNLWDGKFIVQGENPDWVVYNEDNVDNNGSKRSELWSTAESTNQICPCGFVVPDLDDFGSAYFESNISQLKLTMGGFRFPFDEGHEMNEVGRLGFYWTTDPEEGDLTSTVLITEMEEAEPDNFPRIFGASVRCIDPNTRPEPSPSTAVTSTSFK